MSLFFKMIGQLRGKETVSLIGQKMSELASLLSDLDHRVQNLESAATPSPPPTAPIPTEETAPEETASAENTADVGDASGLTLSQVVGAVAEPDPEKGEAQPTRDNTNTEVDPSVGSPETSPESAEPSTSGT